MMPIPPNRDQAPTIANPCSDVAADICAGDQSDNTHWHWIVGDTSQPQYTVVWDIRTGEIIRDDRPWAIR